MFTSTFWKRATLGAAVAAALLTGAPHAMAEGRFRLPYGDVESRMQSKLLIDEATSYVPAVGDDKPQFSSDDVLDSLWFIKACLPKLLDRDRYHSDRVVQSFSSPFPENGRW